MNSHTSVQEEFLARGYPIERMTFAGISEGELIKTASASLALPVVGAALFASMVAVDLGTQRALMCKGSRINYYFGIDLHK